MSRMYRYAYDLWIEAQDIDESEWEQHFSPDEIKTLRWFLNKA